MKICFIQPFDTHRQYYAVIPSMGLASLAAVCENAGHDVRIIDALAQRLTPDQIAQHVQREHPDVAGITFFTPDHAAVQATVQALAQLDPRPVIVLGGPHPTFEPEQTLQSNPGADVLFMAEAENSFPVFLEELEKTAYAGHAAMRTPGAAFRNKDQVLTAPPPPPVDVNALPMPAWHLIKPETYPTAPNGIFSRHPRVAPVIATRGCRFNCAYCAVGRMLGHTVRTRDPESIVAEIQALRERGIGEIHFMDDSFTSDRDFVMRLCGALLNSNLRMPWACPNGVRLDSLDADVLRAMQRAGCYSFAVGIESGSQHILDSMNKGLDIETITEKVRLVRNTTNIKMTGFFIIGYPGETADDIERTIRLALALPLHRANFFNFTPFPGSRIYEKLKMRGALDGIDYSSLYIHKIAYAPEGITKKQLETLQKKAHLRFYMRPRIMAGLLSEIKSPAQVRTVIARAGSILFPHGQRQ
jgi:radical SAM superfamily enzyme YgiQ (UPF0313 family)